MNKLIFNSLAEAIDYSKRNFKGLNVIFDLEIDKIIGGSSKRQAMLNPRLYVINSSSVKQVNSNPSQPKVASKHHKFTKTLSGFDQL